jgi:alpha-N-acetylglucosaminidase
MIEVAEHNRDLVDGPLGHDLVEVGIAFMARVADRLYLDTVERSVRLGTGSPPHAARFLSVFDDLDRTLATRREYTFQHWESKALGWAGDPADQAILLDNARRVITVWSSTAGPLLDDYAGRHWAGLVGGYYRDRWELWTRGLDRALSTPGAGHEAELQERLRDRAEVFLREGPAPAPEHLGDLATESRRLFTAYAGEADSLARPSEHDRRGTR